MVKIKDPKFYTELVIATVLSLVAASLWIEWTKGIVRSYFNSDTSALLGIALAITLLAIFCLHQIAKGRSSHHQENMVKNTELLDNGYLVEH